MSSGDLQRATDFFFIDPCLIDRNPPDRVCEHTYVLMDAAGSEKKKKGAAAALYPTYVKEERIKKGIVRASAS